MKDRLPWVVLGLLFAVGGPMAFILDVGSSLASNTEMLSSSLSGRGNIPRYEWISITILGLGFLYIGLDGWKIHRK